MPRSPGEIVADVEAIGEEHGDQGMYRIAERVGIELDTAFALIGQEQAAGLALRLDVPEDFARKEIGPLMTSIGAIWTHAFLLGALWRQQANDD